MNYSTMENELTGKYREVFEKAELYGVIKNIDSRVQDEMMMDLFDILLSAQKDGKPVEKIIGMDIEAFCQGYYQEYSIKERAKYFPKKIYGLAKLILLMQVLELFWLREERIPFLQIESDIAPYMIGLGIGIILLFIIDIFFRPIIFKFNKLNINKWYGILLVFYVAAVIGGAFLADRALFTVKMKSFYILAGVSIYIIVYAVARSIYRYNRYGSIRREKQTDNEYESSSVFSFIKASVNKERFVINVDGKDFAFSSIKASVNNELPKELAKRYENMNRKRRKRKKQEITPEEYMELLKDETKKLSNTKGVMIFYIIFTIVIIMINAFTSEPADTLLFAVILCAIEYSVYRAWKKVNAGIVKARERLFDDCTNKGCNIIEYAQKRQ